MITETIKYTDYNGTERTETYYFNLSKPELLKIEMSEEGSFGDKLKEAVRTNNVRSIIDSIELLILKSIGVKSEDGRRLVKSEELSKAFQESPAYEELYMKLMTNADAAAAFINGIMPSDIAAQLPKTEEELTKMTESLLNDNAVKGIS